MIKLDLTHIIDVNELNKYSEDVKRINKMINEKTGPGNDFLGWVDWPVDYDKEEVNRMIKSAKYVRENFDILVVCGIGGSYLGARCALEAIKGLKYNDSLEIIFISSYSSIVLNKRQTLSSGWSFLLPNIGYFSTSMIVSQLFAHVKLFLIRISQ